VNNVKKFGIETRASQITHEHCGRCGAPIEKNAFCPACLVFFRGLSRRITESAKVARRMQKRYSRVENK
jgi:uncharacterized Zn finger protein (UPF0148 family)